MMFEMPCKGFGTFTATVSGFSHESSTLMFECSPDGLLWSPLIVTDVDEGGKMHTFNGGNGYNPRRFKGTCKGLHSIRVNCLTLGNYDSVVVGIEKLMSTPKKKANLSSWDPYEAAALKKAASGQLPSLLDYYDRKGVKRTKSRY
jgi:hypothetical protein